MGAQGPTGACDQPLCRGGGLCPKTIPLYKVRTQALGGGTCQKSYVWHNGGGLWLNKETADTVIVGPLKAQLYHPHTGSSLPLILKV